MGTAAGKSLLRKLVFENNIDGFRKLLVHAEAVKVNQALSNLIQADLLNSFLIRNHPL